MITVNGLPVLAARITMPVVGVWSASLEAISEEDITGTATIAQEGAASLVGTVVRSGVLSGSCRLEMVGGKGGLRGDVAARSYQRATARTVIGELLAACGETLDETAQRATLTTSLPFWTRAGGRASTALTTLTDALGARWRVLSNGNVWVGTESWPSPPDAYLADELDRDDAAQNVLLAPDTIALFPGVTLAGRHVGRVEHTVGRDAPLRTTYWIEP